MQSSVASRTVDQPDKKLQQQNKPISFLQNWSKTTKARFGLKLYTFTPKKTIQASSTHIPIKQRTPDKPMEPPSHEANQQSKRTNEVNTPEQKQQRKKRVRTTYAKSDSESSEYHPNKKAKLQRKREEKARQMKCDPLGKNVLFG